MKEIEKFKRKVKFLSPEEAANLVSCLFHCIIVELHVREWNPLPKKIRDLVVTVI